MKLEIAFAALMVVAVVAKPFTNLDTSVLEYLNKNPGTGEYAYKVVLSDGQSRSETGRLVHSGTEDEHIAVEGSFDWEWNGQPYHVKYFSDETGFHAEGSHIPH